MCWWEEACQMKTDIVNHNHIQNHFRLSLPIHHLVSGHLQCGCGQCSLQLVYGWKLYHFSITNREEDILLDIILSNIFSIICPLRWLMDAARPVIVDRMTVLLVEHLLTTGSIIIVISQTMRQKLVHY